MGVGGGLFTKWTGDAPHGHDHGGYPKGSAYHVLLDGHIDHRPYRCRNLNREKKEQWNIHIYFYIFKKI